MNDRELQEIESDFADSFGNLLGLVDAIIETFRTVDTLGELKGMVLTGLAVAWSAGYAIGKYGSIDKINSTDMSEEDVQWLAQLIENNFKDRS